MVSDQRTRFNDSSSLRVDLGVWISAAQVFDDLLSIRASETGTQELHQNVVKRHPELSSRPKRPDGSPSGRKK